MFGKSGSIQFLRKRKSTILVFKFQLSTTILYTHRQRIISVRLTYEVLTCTDYVSKFRIFANLICFIYYFYILQFCILEEGTENMNNIENNY